MIRYLKRSIAALILVLAIVYAADWAWVECKASWLTGAFGAVEVQRYYAVKQKDGKTEFLFDNPAKETCVNSIFPHRGHDPCWYLRRHSRQQVNL